MVSNKKRTIMHALKNSKIDFSLYMPITVKQHIQEKYNCSPYLAKQCAEEIININESQKRS
jgi:hypothetical protein